ncbi:14683_t:CDS:1, partial [Funneliformis mosseae]
HLVRSDVGCIEINVVDHMRGIFIISSATSSEYELVRVLIFERYKGRFLRQVLFKDEFLIYE